MASQENNPNTLYLYQGLLLRKKMKNVRPARLISRRVFPRIPGIHIIDPPFTRPFDEGTK